MKRNKVESILLIAVLALSIQTGSYSAAITDKELDQYYAKTFKRKAQMLLYGSIGYGMERSRKGGGIKQKQMGRSSMERRMTN